MWLWPFVFFNNIFTLPSYITQWIAPDHRNPCWYWPSKLHLHYLCVPGVSPHHQIFKKEPLCLKSSVWDVQKIQRKARGSLPPKGLPSKGAEAWWRGIAMLGGARLVEETELTKLLWPGDEAVRTDCSWEWSEMKPCCRRELGDPDFSTSSAIKSCGQRHRDSSSPTFLISRVRLFAPHGLHRYQSENLPIAI